MLKPRFIASLLAFSALFTTSVSARQPDHGCYLQTSSGQIINLSQSVCQFDLGDFTKQDAAYLSAVRRMMEGYDEPWMTEMVANNPGAFTAAAREYCEARRSGVSQQQFMESRYRSVLQSQASVSSARSEAEFEEQQRSYQAKLLPVSIAMSLAPQHYCSEVQQRRAIR
ncbi:hypothetical protein LEP3755_21520 [Leptolyngbya sp. NIES-3755]|nr:hypothetical protein LEP3755_21520 [Leptolyngbya sp. NIES-3755]